MEDLITKIEQMQAEARDGMKRASRDSDPYLYQYLVGKFHAFGKVAGILKKQKEQSFTHHEIDESLSDAVTHQMEDDGDVDDFVRRGIDEIAFKYAELGAKWQKEQKPAEWVLPEDFEEAVYKVANFISPFDNQEELRKTSHRFAEQLLSLAKKELDKPAEWSEDIIRKAVKEVGLTQHQIDWFKTNVFPPKPEWSEEDEEVMEDLYNFVISDFIQDHIHETRWKPWKTTLERNRQNRLKSIRPVGKESLQSWKPSEEQMKALLRVVDKARELHYSSNSGYDEYDVLRLLYKQLKEL